MPARQASVHYSHAMWTRLEPVLTRFEANWRPGIPTALEPYLVGNAEDQQALLVELVHADLELRLKNGEAARLESYLHQFPQLTSDPSVLLELITAEYRLRQRCEPDLAWEEYQQRFPHLQTTLAAGLGQLQQGAAPVHQVAALEEAPTLAPTPSSRGRHDSGQGQPIANGAQPIAPASQGNWPEIPGYEILGELGRGGMGVVYKARQVRLNRLVALKMILAGGYAETEDVARFRAEAEAVAQLQHPHIVQIHEIGEVAGRPFFSLEFVEGGSLDRKINGTPLPARQAAEIVAALARAMHYAHERGIVHRDLKPANILLSAELEARSAERPDARPSADALLAIPKITDFGLAKQINSDKGQTRSGAILGTPSYMAPEQAGGQGKQVGPAADIYALGAILYELLTGRPPFKAATPLDTVLQVISEEPVAPTQLQPRLPRDLETVCLKCLRKEPRKRYATAQELADELDRFLAGDPVLARPVGALERAVRWVRKHPGRAAVAAAVVAVIGFVIGFQAVNERKERERAEELERANTATNAALRDARQRKAEADRSTFAARQAHRQAENARRQAVAAEQDVRRGRDAAVDQLYATSIDLAYREWQQNNVYRAQQLLNDCPAAQRGWEWNYLNGLCHQARMTLFGHAGAVNSLAISADRRRLVSCDSASARFWDLTTGRELFTLGATGPLAFSPDGRRVALVNSNTVKVVDAQDGRELLVLPEGRGRVVAVAFADEGRQLLTVTTGDNTVHRWDASTGKKLSQVKLQSGLFFINQDEHYWPALSADGTRLAAGPGWGETKVWDTTTGRLLHTFKDGPLMRVTQTAFNRQGNRLAIAWGEGTVMVRELPSGKELRRWRAHKGTVGCLAFSPNGKRLATGADDLAIRLWDLATYTEVLTLRGHTSDIWALAFTSNGKRLISSGNERSIKVWDLADRRYFSSWRKQIQNYRLLIAGTGEWLPFGTWEHRTYYGHVSPTLSLAFSPDSRLAATSGIGDRNVAVWNLEDSAPSREKHLFPIPGGRTCTLAFAPRQKWLLGLCPARDDQPVQMKLWDLTRGRVLLDRTGPHGQAKGIVFLPGGKVAVAALAVGASTRLYWYALPSGKEVGHLDLDGVSVHSLALTSSGKHLVAGSSDQVVVIDAVRRRQVCSFKVPSMATLAVSRDGIVATGHNDMLIRLYDLATGTLVRELEGHAGPLRALAFSPDGRRLLSAGGDQALKVWNPATGRELLTFRDHVRGIESVAWSADGRKIGSVGWDHALRIWEPAASTTESADNWPVLFADRFNRKTLGPSWSPGANRRIEKGALRAELVDTMMQGGWDKFPAALVTLAGVRLPDTVEVRCEVWTPHRLVSTLALINPRTGLSIQPLLIGSPSPFGYTGANLLLMRGDGGEGAVAGQPRKKFQFLPNRRYLVRVLRQRTQITLTVNSEVIFRETVPAGPAPLLLLEGSWGRVGDVVYFDNLEIRAPKTAVHEQQLRDRVETWFDRYQFRQAVAEEIDKDANLSEADRRFMRAQVLMLAEDPSKLLAACTAVAMKPRGSAAVYALAVRQAETVVRLAPSDLQGRFALGTALYRAGRYEEASATLARLQELQRVEQGSGAPGVLAVQAMTWQRLGKKAEARGAVQQARDLLRSIAWSHFGYAKPLVEEAETLIGPVSANDAATRQVEAIKDVVFGADQAGWYRGDLEAYLASFTEDAIVVDGRAEQPENTDVTYDRHLLRQIRPHQFAGTATGDGRNSYEEVRVRLEGDRAVCRYRGTHLGSGYYQTWQVNAHLRKTPQGWKIDRLRYWPVVEKGPTLRRFDAAYWKAQDEAVAKARQAGNQRRLGRALEEARRFAEALPVARTLTARPKATAEDWALYGRIAFTLGHVPESRQAFRRALRQQPALELPWYLSRLRKSLSAPGIALLGVDWHPDGKRVISGGTDGRAVVWNVHTGQAGQTNTLPLGWVCGLAYQPGGKVVAAGGTDRIVRLWDTASGRELRALPEHGGRVYRLAFDLTGRRLVTASADGLARVWEVASGRELLALRHSGEVMGAVFSPDGKHVATASKDGTARIWDAATGKEIWRLRGHRGHVLRVAYRPDGTQLATVGSDATVRLWDAATGKELHTLRGHGQPVEVAVFSPDGRRLVSGGNGSEIILWDARTGQALEYLRGHTGFIFALAFRADGKRLASASGDGTVRIWDMRDW